MKNNPPTQELNTNAAPTLVLFCGLPGSGKTTLARKLAVINPMIRLNTDEWMADLGLDLNDDEQHIKLQKRLWRLAKELLRFGQDVVLEDGLWTRKERDDKRREAKELGVRTELHYLKVPLDELIHRLEARNASGIHGVAPISKDQIEFYATLFETPDDAELALFSKVIIHEQ